MCMFFFLFKGFVSFVFVNVEYFLNQSSLNKDLWSDGSLLGFSVYISNTTNKEDGVLCFRDTNYTTTTIYGPLNITCPYRGRYVIYYNNRTHPPFSEKYFDYTFIGLCEVQVYGKNLVCFTLGNEKRVFKFKKKIFRTKKKTLSTHVNLPVL